MSELISSDELDFIGVRFMDPVGKVYLKDSFYHRAIYPEKVDYIKQFLNSTAYKDLVIEGLIPELEVADIQIDGFGLVLKTKAIENQFKPSTLTTLVLKKAALNWIKINQILAESDKGLIDAHFGNTVVNGKAQPLWVDIGSIQSVNTVLQGFGEFLNTHLNPLFIFAHKKKLTKIARLLLDNGGLTFKETLSIIGYHHLKYNLILLLLFIGKVLMRFKKNPLWYRKLCLNVLNKFIQSLNVSPSGGYWSNYRNVELPDFQIKSEMSGDPRDAVIKDLVKGINPSSIVDVGANNGHFLCLIANSGMDLVAVEPDEKALQSFVAWIDRLDESADINAYACVSNFYNTQAQGDLVLGLAVTHHIALTDKFKFDFIAKRFFEITTKSLVVEFMPNGLNPKQHPDNLPDWYSLDMFLKELKKYFQHVEVIEYERPKSFSPRILIYCDIIDMKKVDAKQC